MPAELRLCLIGEGIVDSPSAAMQEAALRASGRLGTYELVDVGAAGLPAVLRRLRSGHWHGANVTVPYKEALAHACDQLRGDASRTGAVNTVTVTADGRLLGDNTDAQGFELGLSVQGLWPLPDTRAVVLGSGGAAAAVVLALTRVPTQRITVAARRVSAARALVERLSATTQAEIAVALWDPDFLSPVLRTAEVVVNATSAGLDQLPLGLDQLQPSCTVADVRYRPRPVDLVAAALQAGRRAADGVEMLFHQGMLSFQVWTGEQPAFDTARAALQRSLME